MGTRTSTMRRVRFAAAAAGLAAWTATWADAARPPAVMRTAPDLQRSGSAKGDSVGADISIARGRVRADGTPEGVNTEVRYHWERERVNGRWRTVVTLPPTMSWAIDPETGAPRDAGERAVRVEDDEDGTPLRFFNGRGEQMEIPSPADLQRARGEFSTLPGPTEALDAPIPPAPVGPQMLRPSLTAPGRSWADTLVLDRAGSAARRSALERANGASRERLRGLDRFVSRRGDAAIETLVDPEWVVPVEVNIVRDGALVMHTMVKYAGGANGTLVRQQIHSTRLAGSAGERATVDVQFANVRTTAGGAR
jgi:hypothetical protein